jgi:hypothetical protein
MTFRITQELLDEADLVVVVGRNGAAQWSSHRGKPEVISALRQLAEQIEADVLMEEAP